MFRRIFRPIYIPFLKHYNKIIFFIIPNLLSKVNLVCKETPLVQQKMFITGKGKILIGKNCSFGFKTSGFHYKGSIEIQARTPNSEIILGDHISTNNNIFICSSQKISIGHSTLIGEGVCIMDFEAHAISPEKRREVGEIGTVEIGENVWIGNKVTILKNFKIGKNSIVAAGAVVSGVFPENVIIGGVPAKIIQDI